MKETILAKDKGTRLRHVKVWPLPTTRPSKLLRKKKSTNLRKGRSPIVSTRVSRSERLTLGLNLAIKLLKPLENLQADKGEGPEGPIKLEEHSPGSYQLSGLLPPSELEIGRIRGKIPGSDPGKKKERKTR
jgi:hypothetical protein